jgi:hypothetical protein
MTNRFWDCVGHLELPVEKLTTRRVALKPMRMKRQRIKGYGWHAFRHSVVDGLVNAGISSVAINKWIGWQSGDKNAPMVSLYALGEVEESSILTKHPYLKLWK